MRGDIAEKWIAALLSGDFSQGSGVLRDEDDQYCCLGVLCELAIREGVTGLRWAKTNEADYFLLSMPDSGSYEGHLLPWGIREWAGLKDVVGVYGRTGRNLAADNDNGQTFAQIAATIREQVEEL